MGVIYSVSCTECKVTRDLDKFYTAQYCEEETREDMLRFSDEIRDDSFRAALLVDFMARHAGHPCVFFWENMDCEDLYDPFENEDGYVEDVDFWRA